MAQRKIRNNTDQRVFTMIYHDFYKSNLLDHYEKSLFIALKIFSDSNNQCYPSVKKLADTTGMSERKVRDTLKSLEKKHIISIENRTRIDGGATSNLYTLHDYKELWNAVSDKEAATVIDRIEEEHMIKVLTDRGYYVSKEKEPESLPADQSNNASSTQLNNFDINKDTTDQSKSQDLERYTMSDIKILYEYDSLIIKYPEKQIDIDIVFDILYEMLNSTKQTIRIGGENRPGMAVIGKLMKLQPGDLIYSIDKYHEQTGRIKNVKGYLLVILFNSHEQNHLDLMNLGHHNGDF